MWVTFDDDTHVITASASHGDTVNIIGKVGEIRVSGWNKNTVSVAYTKHVSVLASAAISSFDPDPYFSDVDVKFETSENTPGLTVRVTFDETDYSLMNRAVDLEIMVPSKAVLNVANNIGDIGVEKIFGVINANNDVGDIEIDYPYPPESGESVSVATNVGDIALYLPEESEFSCRAETNVGEIDAYDFPTLRTKIVDFVGARCTGAIGDGLGSILLNTDTGDIGIWAD
jgi:hypothetical protein